MKHRYTSPSLISCQLMANFVLLPSPSLLLDILNFRHHVILFGLFIS